MFRAPVLQRCMVRVTNDNSARIVRTSDTEIFTSTPAPTLFGADKQTFPDNES